VGCDSGLVALELEYNSCSCRKTEYDSLISL